MSKQNQREKKSQHHFIYNTQLDMSKFLKMTDNEQRALISGLLRAAKELKENYKKYIHCKSPKDREVAKITKYHTGLEFGRSNADMAKYKRDGKEVERKRRHLLHIDGFVAFDRYCQLDYKKISDMFNSHVAPFGINGFFNNTYIKDSVEDAYNYSKKERISLVE